MCVRGGGTFCHYGIMSFSRRPRCVPSITFRPALPFSNLRKVVYCCTCVCCEITPSIAAAVLVASCESCHLVSSPRRARGATTLILFMVATKLSEWLLAIPSRLYCQCGCRQQAQMAVRLPACSHPKVITQGSGCTAKQQQQRAPLASYIFMSIYICELNAPHRRARSPEKIH